MNKNLAIIKDGVVIHCIVWNDENEFIPDEGYVGVFDEQVGPGWLYDGQVFTQPVSPEEVVQIDDNR
jgi:hypothetical protein